MKEILSCQYDAVFGGSDKNGSGQGSANNSGSSSSNSGNRGIQSFLSTNSPYGSGSGASGIWGGGPNTMSTGSGYSGNGTGPR